MRLILLLLIPLCSIGLAWLVPVKREGGQVSNTIAQIDALKPDSYDVLCRAVKSNAKIIRAGIASLETQIQITKYEAEKPLPVYPVEVFDATGRSRFMFIQKDTLKNE